MVVNNRKRSPFERYRDYVTGLEVSGKKFPVNQYGDVNFSKIADECGNRRQWFSESAKKVFCAHGNTLEELIAMDIRRIGSDFGSPRKPESVIVEVADSQSREAGRLRTLLEQRSKENELLRDQVQVLLAEVRLLRTNASEIDNQQELMIDSGRSFHL